MRNRPAEASIARPERRRAPGRTDGTRRGRMLALRKKGNDDHHSEPLTKELADRPM
jgi:hypothetical protein